MHRQLPGIAAVLFAALTLPAMAQLPRNETGARPGNEIGTGNSLPRSNRSSNTVPGDTRSVIAPNLPSPSVDDDATSRQYLVAARQALKAGQTGKAQQSLEMAETRMLDRSTEQGQTQDPSQNPGVQRITDARHALGTGDRRQAMTIIDGMLTR